METHEERTIRGLISKLKELAKDSLGEGVWGLKKDGEKFTHEEIVFLFARVFPVLGIDHIKEIRSEFPDCTCVKEGIEIGIEFEPLLSSFKDHFGKEGHDLSKCQCIICWKDDLGVYDSMHDEIKECGIDIIELRELYEEIGIKSRKEVILITQKMIDGLRENQLKVLKAYITTGKDKLTGDQIAKETGVSGKGLGGVLGGFKQRQKNMSDWLIRQRPDKKTWEFNTKHKDKVASTLKKYTL